MSSARRIPLHRPVARRWGAFIAMLWPMLLGLAGLGAVLWAAVVVGLIAWGGW